MSEINRNSILMKYHGPLQQAEYNPNRVVIAGGIASIPTGLPFTVESNQLPAPQYDGAGVDFTRMPETLGSTEHSLQIVNEVQPTEACCECCCAEVHVGVAKQPVAYGHPPDCKDTDSPQIAIVSYIAPFDVDKDLNWDDIKTLHAKEFGSKPSSMELLKYKAALLGLQDTHNEEPPEFLVGDKWTEFQNTKQYRGLQAMRLTSCCRADAIPIFYGSVSDYASSSGYTPLYSTKFKVTIAALIGESASIVFAPLTGPTMLVSGALSNFDAADGEDQIGDYGQNRYCNWQEMFEKSRVGPKGRTISKTLLDLGVPYRWTKTRFTHCCNGAWKVDLSASQFPSVAVYVDGKKVFTHHQSNLAQFLFAGEGALAPGGAQGGATNTIKRAIPHSGGAVWEEFDPATGTWLAKAADAE